nr:hypothetical protein CFP56_34704 [Quercus suber]
MARRSIRGLWICVSRFTTRADQVSHRFVSFSYPLCRLGNVRKRVLKLADHTRAVGRVKTKVAGCCYARGGDAAARPASQSAAISSSPPSNLQTPSRGAADRKFRTLQCCAPSTFLRRVIATAGNCHGEKRYKYEEKSSNGRVAIISFSIYI